MTNFLRKACKLYLKLAAGVFFITACVLMGLTLYGFVVASLGGSGFHSEVLLERVKLLALLSIVLPLLILLAIGFFRGVFKLLGVEVKEENK